MLGFQNRKRNADEICIFASNGIHPNNVQTSEVLRQDGMKEEVQRDGSGSHEHHIEGVALNISSKLQTADASKTLKSK